MIDYFPFFILIAFFIFLIHIIQINQRIGCGRERCSCQRNCNRCDRLKSYPHDTYEGYCPCSMDFSKKIKIREQ